MSCQGELPRVICQGELRRLRIGAGKCSKIQLFMCVKAPRLAPQQHSIHVICSCGLVGLQIEMMNILIALSIGGLKVELMHTCCASNGYTTIYYLRKYQKFITYVNISIS